VRIQFARRARRELIREANWYDRQGPRLGNEFLDDVTRALRQIKEFPLAAPEIGGGYRRHILDRFPFGLVYRLRGQAIVILAVAHHKRRPRYWRNQPH
jgi:toxin ParE1/3/4